MGKRALPASLEQYTEPKKIRAQVSPSEKAKVERQPGKFFKASRKIYKPDGWMNERGIFWGCAPDEHDECARYVYKLYYKTPQEPVDPSEVRNGLFNAGFVQLSKNIPILPQQRLKKRQIEAIDRAGLKIPVSLTDPTLMEKFEGFQQAMREGKISNEQLDLVRRFADNNMQFFINNEPKVADTLLDVLSIGFTEHADWRSMRGDEEYKYRAPETKEFAIELRHHKHDGSSGLEYTSWVNLVPYSEMVWALEESQD